MVIETETGLLAWQEVDGETLITQPAAATGACFVAEVSGETLGAGPADVDGMLEVLMTKGKIADLAITEGSTVTVRSANYNVALIDAEEASAGEGFSLLYLEPL